MSHMSTVQGCCRISSVTTAGCLTCIPAISLKPSVRFLLEREIPEGKREMERASTVTEAQPCQCRRGSHSLPHPPAVGCEDCSDCSMHQSMCGGVKVREEVALQKGVHCTHSIRPVERSDTAEMGSICKGRTWWGGRILKGGKLFVSQAFSRGFLA